MVGVMAFHLKGMCRNLIFVMNMFFFFSISKNMVSLIMCSVIKTNQRIIKMGNLLEVVKGYNKTMSSGVSTCRGMF